MSYLTYEEGLNHPISQGQYSPTIVRTYPAKEDVPCKKKKESDMIATANYAQATATLTATPELPGRREKDYLLSRLDMINDNHIKKLREYFHIDDDTPKSPKELHRMLQDGHYTLDTKRIEQYGEEATGDEEDLFWGNLFYFIRFRNPKHKKDKDGYKKATESLKTTRQKTKDAIIVKSLDEGLLALEAFESETFH